jgi:hypothetical protein
LPRQGVHFTLAYRLYEWKKAVFVDQPAIAAKLEELADRVVATANDAIERMSASGDLRDLNQAFKQARKADPSVRYVEYLEPRKAAMLEADVDRGCHHHAGAGDRSSSGTACHCANSRAVRSN